MQIDTEEITNLARIGRELHSLNGRKLSKSDYVLLYNFLKKDFLPLFNDQVKAHGDIFDWKRHINN